MARQSVSSRSCPDLPPDLADRSTCGRSAIRQDVVYKVWRGLVQLQVFFTVAYYLPRSLGCWCTATGGAARLPVWYQHI